MNKYKLTNIVLMWITLITQVEKYNQNVDNLSTFFSTCGKVEIADNALPKTFYLKLIHFWLNFLSSFYLSYPHFVWTTLSIPIVEIMLQLKHRINKNKKFTNLC